MTAQTASMPKPIYLQDYGHLEGNLIGSLAWLGEKTSLGISAEQLYNITVEIFSSKDEKSRGIYRLVEAVIDNYDNLLKYRNWNFKIMDESFQEFVEKLRKKQEHNFVCQTTLEEIFNNKFEEAAWRLIEKSCEDPKKNNMCVLIYKKV